MKHDKLYFFNECKFIVVILNTYYYDADAQANILFALFMCTLFATWNRYFHNINYFIYHN